MPDLLGVTNPVPGHDNANINRNMPTIPNDPRVQNATDPTRVSGPDNRTERQDSGDAAGSERTLRYDSNFLTFLQRLSETPGLAQSMGEVLRAYQGTVVTSGMGEGMAVDMAKLVAVLVNDGVYKEQIYGYTEVKDVENGTELMVAEPLPGKYKETRLLTEESVADMETPRFRVELADYASFEQCLILRRQENVLDQDVLYYHTGSAYGVYSLMTYNPETQNGIVVISTGARRNMNEKGMYALCYDLMEILYAKMEEQPV